MKILDNINHTVREDLQDTMQKGSRVSIAAACFSIYAYQELKKQLEEIAELRFIFTSPTFVQENTPKERREFYIPKLTREKSLTAQNLRFACGMNSLKKHWRKNVPTGCDGK